MKLEPIFQATTQVGYLEDAAFGIGLTLLVCTVIYTVPHMAFLGTILLSGYLGGAIATQVRAEDPWFVLPALSRCWCGAGSSCAMAGSACSSPSKASRLAGRCTRRRNRG